LPPVPHANEQESIWRETT